MSQDTIATLRAALDSGHALPETVRRAVLSALARELVSAAQAATAEDAEQSLRKAADLDRLVGLAALARLFQRQKRWNDAVAIWQQLVALEHAEPDVYLNLARCYERLDQPELALSTYLRLIDEAPTARSYLTVAARLDDLAVALPEVAKNRRIRIALLSNATLDHLANYLRVECFRAGLRPTIYQAPFDQVTQQILDSSSGLYSFAPDVVICAIHASRLFPNIHQDPFELTADDRHAELDEGLDTLRQLLDGFTERSSATLLVHNMVSPQHPARGILDWRDDLGQAALFAEINTRLAELARKRYRSVYVIDEDRVQARAGKAHATDARLWLTARVPWRESVHLGLAREYVRFLKALRGQTRKCIVVDLDNTLWGGVVGEDGIDGIDLGADAPGNAYVAFQRELLRLWRRGVLLALCSKNNVDDAMAVFERHPAMVLKREHVAAQRINWQSKSANLREIAAELNIGIDSLVFIDDNPVERAAIRADLPEVFVPELPSDPADYRQMLLDLDMFESLVLTDEDTVRGRLYAEQAQRREYENSARGASLEDYLAGLNMVVEIVPATVATLPRIVQLTNKTNQFNMTTRRYSDGDLATLSACGAEIYGMRVSDRFGDNGLVGVAILRPLADGSREIDTFLLSCRVMGRGVETALLSFLVDRARAQGSRLLLGRFIPTAKNSPSRAVYADNGFTLTEEFQDGSQLWQLDLATQQIEPPAWLTVQAPEPIG